MPAAQPSLPVAVSAVSSPAEKAPAVGLPAASSGANTDFSAFLAAPSSPPSGRAKPSGRWSVVAPRSAKRKKSAPKHKKGVVAEPTKPKDTEATASFGAKTAADFPSLKDKNIEVHTLVLGTHPSVCSLEESQYYGHQMNAFWWIAGDCLGFRRDTGLSPSSGKPYRFAEDLRYDNILPYEKQLELFCSKGFALWDIVASCTRPGSLDSDITEDKPNDIVAFCEKHPSVRRIVLTGGTSGCGFLKKHFKWWLDSGAVVPCSHPTTMSQFKKWVVPESEQTPQQIQIISALAVSPAAARYTYAEKRDFWEKYVYGPGLADHEAIVRRLSRKRKFS